MLATRIIPCLDIKEGRIVKGVKFVDLRDAGDPLEAAEYYAHNGADELCFLDITASSQKRAIAIKLVTAVAERIFIPFTVGGGLRTLSDIDQVLHAGADKVSLNTAAFQEPKLLTQAAQHFGSQCVVCAIDARQSNKENTKAKNDFEFEVYLHGGRTPTGHDAVTWAKQAVECGAGEILLTSMDRDGTAQGYDLDLIRAVRNTVNVPVIASGGVGTLEHIVEAILEAQADAVLAASIFHFKKYSIAELKNMLLEREIPVREALC